MKTKTLILLFTFLSLCLAFCKNVNTPDSVKSEQSINYVANRKELAWLKTNCIKIKTVQSDNGFDDLQPLKKMIGSSRIVALGENTHGTSEVFKMKHRLIEFLATEMGFTILSVEVGMPEASLLNDYVINGNGDPQTIIKSWGLHLNTQEFLDMIEWMRKFNVSGKGRIQFTGFDMQYAAGALDNLNKFAKLNNLTLKSSLDTLSNVIERLQSEGPQFLEDQKALDYFKLKCENVFSYISENKKSITKTINESEFNWLLQNANILIQSAEAAIRHDEISFRDKCMAENVEWILNANPTEKIILWGHIGHLRKELPWMGGYLFEKFGSNYYSIGTVSNSGTYTANNSFETTTTNVLNESKPGSFEYSFHKLGVPIFYFDYNQVNESKPESKWLKSALFYRGIGAVATQDQFQPVNISEWFNAIIYFDSTHASDLLKK
jgi:erythromycin esterase